MVKNYLFIALLAFASSVLQAQSTFKKGYYINDEGVKTEGYIMDNDWKDNPVAFDFKTSENGAVASLGIDEVREFGIYEVDKFIKAKVDIDVSSENLDEMSENKEPEFEERLVFLKVLAEGQVDLFVFQDDNLRRYFYRSQDSGITQLINKSYKSRDNRVLTNAAFRGQLWDVCKCSGITFNQVRSLNYTRRDLLGFIEKYHDCIQEDLTVYKGTEKGFPIHLSVRPRMSYSSLSITNNAGSDDLLDFDFDGQWGFGLGVEVEYTLPFNNDKWRFFAEPTYQCYKAEKTKETDRIGFENFTATVDYSSIEIPFGFRHYFYLSKRSQMFLNAQGVLDVPMNGTVELSRGSGSPIEPLELRNSFGFGAGLGYTFDAFLAELRYSTARNVLNSSLFYEGSYPSFSVILGYRLF